MADTNFMPEPAVAQAASGVLPDEPQNRELLRKKPLSPCTVCRQVR